MMTVIDNVRWRLRFHHTQKPPKSGKRGVTQCWVEVWEKHVELEGWFSVPGTYGETSCGRRDNFTRETGRQFALVRALRAALQKGSIDKTTASALIHAYVQSAPKGRVMCDDLLLRGFRSLYDAVFDPLKLWEWHTSNKRPGIDELNIALGQLNLRDQSTQHELQDAKEWAATA